MNRAYKNCNRYYENSEMKAILLRCEYIEIYRSWGVINCMAFTGYIGGKDNDLKILSSLFLFWPTSNLYRFHRKEEVVTLKASVKNTPYQD